MHQNNINAVKCVACIAVLLGIMTCVVAIMQIHFRGEAKEEAELRSMLATTLILFVLFAIAWFLVAWALFANTLKCADERSKQPPVVNEEAA